MIGIRSLALLAACGGALTGPALTQTTQFIDVAPLGHLPTAMETTFGIALADLDGDGDRDAFLATRAGPRLYLNDGRGRFVDNSSALPPRSDACHCVALGDVDGDGDLDATLGTETGTDLLFLGDGQGGFSDASNRLPPRNFSTDTNLLGDVDGDGDLDLLRGILFDGLQLFVNDGAGQFAIAPSQLPPQQLSTPTDLALGDVDGDGDPDLAWAGGLAGLRTFVYHNDGQGSFTDGTATAIPGQASINARALHLGDLDGDGDLDLLTVGTPNHQLYLNDGSGVFGSASHLSLPATTIGVPSDLAAGDFDEDGDLDCMVAASALFSPAPNALWLNDGAANFTDGSATRLSATHRPSVALACGDLDGDADLDVMVGNGSGIFGAVDDLYLNRHRHLETTVPPTLGGTLALRFTAAPGYGQVSHIALAGLAFRLAAAPVPVPFGVLFLRPAGVLPLPWAVIPATTHAGVVHLTVPPDPVLSGSTVYVQSLFIEPFGAVPPALTGYTEDVIL